MGSLDMHLLDACREVMNDDSMKEKYPGGLTAENVLAEIHIKHPGGFPLVSWIDVHDEMRKFYGEPLR